MRALEPFPANRMPVRIACDVSQQRHRPAKSRQSRNVERGADSTGSEPAVAPGAVASAFLAVLCCAPALAADLADVSRWAGKEPFTKIVGGKTLWDQNGVQEAMRAAMGQSTFSLARKTLFSGPQAPVAANGKGAFVAWSCKAHDCGDNQISVFFDSSAGTAEACMRIADRSGRVRDLWLSRGEARPLPAETCLSSGNDPFALLQKFGSRS